MKKLTYFTFCLLLIAPVAAKASDFAWKLLPEESKVAYGTIKSGNAGETAYFTSISGGVDETGDALIEIDLASLETWADTRNERMQAHVFDSAHPKALLKAEVDMSKLKGLEAGASTIINTNAILSFNGTDYEISTDMFVARLGEERVLAVTDEMIMLSTQEIGIDQGVDKLLELASLSSITRAFPVSLRFVFEQSR